MKHSQRVGIFDSGAGGLTVVKSIMEHRFFDEIIYYGDTARVPYGTKDAATITRYALEALEFFKNFDIDLLITACNSVSAHALPEMRANAEIPIYGVIDPGVKALQNSGLDPSSRILILGTRATIQSGRYQKGIEAIGYKNIESIAPSLFVPVVEEGVFEGPVLQSVMTHYFKAIETPDAVILGCTHFPLIAEAIRDYFPNAPLLIHSGEAIAEHLEEQGYLSKRVEKTKLKIFASENPDNLKAIAAKWLQQ
ncbi:glutamate racemase [Hydrogenimonas urashimensis]|uniref:glutamate racemase n=1 Tax=Hydrogenimonas urashimensis TaxID=2740515 RepID=UPI0019156289|nr:glutamate racemase [Hydrogenimonas urashimensis]